MQLRLHCTTLKKGNSNSLDIEIISKGLEAYYIKIE